MRYEGEWCAETRVAMTGVRLPPTAGPTPVEYPEGAEVEVYDKLMGAPYSAYWKATIRVRFSPSGNTESINILQCISVEKNETVNDCNKKFSNK